MVSYTPTQDGSKCVDLQLYCPNAFMECEGNTFTYTFT